MPPLIQALLDPRCYPHAVESVRLLETHISWVLLTGSYAYKIKKPLRLDFLDFGTLELRLHYCREELRLNRRFAPEIYLDVVAITGDVHAPRVEGAEAAAVAPLEYALKMREFPQQCLFDQRLEAGDLTAAEIDALARTCARIHAEAAVAPPATPFGAASTLLAPALDNFATIERLPVPEQARAGIATLRHWTESEHARLADVFTARKASGRIRECHGDLHLGNIALIDAEPMLFDCIEFNDSFRWIDVIDEMAFAVMDLHARGRADFGQRLLNGYLEASGDYEGVRVLRYYLVYRAAVRAKIDCIRAVQAETPARGEAQWHDFERRIGLAGRFARGVHTYLAITCGLSGSGKTYASELALERTSAIRIRSDAERKRLAGLDSRARSGSDIDAGLYSTQASERTFARLAELARTIVDSGYPVIVDGTFIERERRRPFRELAAALRVPFLVLHCRAPGDVLAERIVRRLQSRTDASEADLDVLRAQQRRQQVVQQAECSHLIEVDSSDPGSVEAMLDRLAEFSGTH